MNHELWTYKKNYFSVKQYEAKGL